MKTIMIQAIELLISHSQEDFVSKKDAKEAALKLKNVVEKLNDWHYIECVINEVNRAEAKHPNWPDDSIYGMAIIGEEYGEAQREAVKIEMNESDASYDNLKKELIQTAATCFRMLKNLNQADALIDALNKEV